MNTSITVCYQVEWLPVICSFVAETARALGASDKERADLYLAAEETTMHIIESVPRVDHQDAFEVICVIRPDGLEYVFRNIGLPVNVEALPAYDTGAPEESLEGLRLFLARKMVDRLEFVNLGHEGWRTRFLKRLANLCSFDVTSDDSEVVRAGREKIETSVASADDVHDIAELAYLNYRYSYAKEAFYFPDKLKDEMDTGRIVSFIARAQSGLIVGQMARMMDDAGSSIAEIGAVMVRPEYRRSPGLLSLVKTAMRHRDEQSERIRFYTANLVTSHPLSQKLAACMVFKPVGIHVSTHARARFLAIQTGAGRESNLHAVRVQCSPEPFCIYVPKEHFVVASHIFDNAGLPGDVLTDSDEKGCGETVWLAQHDQKARYAVLQTDEYGSDFATSLRSVAYGLSLEGVETVSLRLPAWRPSPPALNEELLRQAFFFCGFTLDTQGRWCILYSRLTNQQFSFDAIEVYDPVAEELKAHVRQSFERII